MTSRETFDVVLRFSSTATPYIRERTWRPSQSIDLTAEGGCVPRVRVSEPIEMQPWIRSWDAQVEVLVPNWLRERVADKLRGKRPIVIGLHRAMRRSVCLIQRGTSLEALNV